MTEALPGTPLPSLPVPAGIARAFGYPGDARYVALFWSPIGDQLVVEDGRSAMSGESWAFLGFRRHRAVAPILDGLPLGYSDEEATHALVIDEEGGRASVAPLAEARAFLLAQHPPALTLNPEEEAAIRERVERLIAEGWREEPVDMGWVVRAMEEQRARVARLMSWLDLAAVAPEREL